MWEGEIAPSHDGLELDPVAVTAQGWFLQSSSSLAELQQSRHSYASASVNGSEILVLDSFSALLVYPGLENGSTKFQM